MKGKKMSLTKELKQQLIKEYAVKEGDTGSPEVQVAVLSAEISALSAHLKKHPKDVHSAKGLSGLVANRRRLLTYLKKNDQARYDALVKRLKLRK
jgi:small subunit ribosomal protein S15